MKAIIEYLEDWNANSGDNICLVVESVMMHDEDADEGIIRVRVAHRALDGRMVTTCTADGEKDMVATGMSLVEALKKLEVLAAIEYRPVQMPLGDNT